MSVSAPVYGSWGWGWTAGAGGALSAAPGAGSGAGAGSVAGGAAGSGVVGSSSPCDWPWSSPANGSWYCSSPAPCAAAAAGAARTAAAASATARLRSDGIARTIATVLRYLRRSVRRLPFVPAAPAPAVAGAPAGDSGAGAAAGLAAAQLAANGIAVIFTAIFARVLGREDYGVLAAALSTFLILSVPGYALQVAVSRAVAARRLGASGELGATMRRWTLRLALATLALAVAGALFRDPLADLLSVDAPWAAAATLPTVTLWVLLSVERGVLAGLGRYRVVGLSIAGEAAGRLVLGLGLVLAGLGTTGAYLGTPLAMALAALVLGHVLARLPAAGPDGGRRAAPAVRLRDVLRDAVVPIAALALIAVLQNVDVIVVRHQVAEVQAGAYAAAAVAAKVVVWTAVGVALYVIPEAAGRTAAGRGARPVLLRASAVVATVAAPALLVMALAPALVLRLGFGPSYEIASDALPLLAVAMSVLALTYLTVNYLLAVGSSRFLAPLAVVALAEPVLLLSGSLDRLTSFAAVVLLVQLAAAGAVVVPTLRRSPAAAPARA